MQLRLRTGLTGEQYVTAQGWRDATLARCPNHPGGGCSLARHGTYARKTPPGTRIARWYCPESHTTFSRLPDCLAARLPGTLAELEDVVATAERAKSLEAAANAVRRDPIELPGAMRWLRRRIRPVRRALATVRGLLPERLAVRERIEAGTEGLVPAAVADRIIDGASPLRVWREHRALSQSALARASGVDRVQVADIEAGRATGSVRTLRALADALGITVDDLLPA